VPFASIVGHAGVVALLSRAIAAGRVPQSLLVAGPDGVGKRTLAIAFAQAVNCPSRRPDGDACGACSTCQRIARGQHSDVTVVTPGDLASIGIKVLRQRVLDAVGYRPFEAARRIYIIDPADLLTDEAQDALLKTLEEPPTGAVLVLVSAYPDTLRPTVQSRCRRLRLGVLSERDVARVLVERCDVDRAKADALAAASGGSVSRALALSGDEGHLAEDREAALAVLTAAAVRGPNVAGRLKAAAALVQHGSKRRDREAIGARLSVAATLVRDLERALRGLAGAFDLPRLSAGFAAIGKAQADLDRSASPKIVADWLALAL
jgi:DNA polymerase III subunit delta'